MAISAVVGAVGAIGSAVVSSSGAQSAADTAAATADKNNALQQSIYNQNSANLSPYVQSGDAATREINGLLGIGGDPNASANAFKTWQNSTGYQNQYQTGLNSVQAALGAKGLSNSGAALKALDNYGTAQANNSFQTYLGNLQGQQQTGLYGASSLAGVGQNYANAVSQNNNNASVAQQNATLAGTTATSNALGGLAGITAALNGSQRMASSYAPSMGGAQTAASALAQGGLMGLAI